MAVSWLDAAQLDAVAWERLIEAAEDATPFHTLGWVDAVASVPGVRVRAVVATDGAAYRAGMLVAERRTGPAVKRAVGVYGAYGSPLVDRACPDAAAVRAALAATLVDGLGMIGSLELADFAGRTTPAWSGITRLEGRTRVLDLTSGYDAARENFEVTVRQKLRQAARAGVTIDDTDPREALASFLRLAASTYARHDSPAPPAGFYAAVVRAMLVRGEARLALARTDRGEVAGAALHLLGGGHVFNWLTAVDPAHGAARPANVLVDDAIRWGASRGACLYNFGATPAGSEGVEAFKKSWGSVPRTYPIWRVRTVGYRILTALRGGRG